MIFNSLEFLYVFLPVTVVIYFSLCHYFKEVTALVWLLLSSLFFYSYYNVSYLPLIVASIVTNYLVAERMGVTRSARSRRILWLGGVTFNLLLLGFFKYYDFFVGMLNQAFSLSLSQINLDLPLAISFFTFQQIAFLVERKRREGAPRSFVRYAAFVSFFPQLIAGPITFYQEIVPQFENKVNKFVNWKNVHLGLFLLGIGLFKKVLLADPLGSVVSHGYSNLGDLTCLEAWRIAICYSFQIYFDFSGYMDMAQGAANLFNIRLPLNFTSPYRSLSIQEFWRRWHITLGRFLRNYLYIPMGGNHYGMWITARNLFLTFLVGGIWHGAGWNFIVWGAMHGFAMIVYICWRHTGLTLPKMVAWATTFLFVTVAWVYFRAPSLPDANSVVLCMFGITGEGQMIGSISSLLSETSDIRKFAWFVLTAVLLSDLLYRDSHEWAARFESSRVWSLATVILFLAGVIKLVKRNSYTEFIYWQF